MSEYSEKLKDPRWQKKRLEIFERDGWKCMACLSKDNTLHVHHIFYLPKKDPWDIPNGLLITLCNDCHGDGLNIHVPQSNAEIIVRNIAHILNVIWSNPDYYGGLDHVNLLANAAYMLKPE